jgi:hypothetical protein
MNAAVYVNRWPLLFRTKAKICIPFSYLFGAQKTRTPKIRQYSTAFYLTLRNRNCKLADAKTVILIYFHIAKSSSCKF